MLARLGLLALALVAGAVGFAYGALAFFDLIDRAAMGAWPH